MKHNNRHSWSSKNKSLQYYLPFLYSTYVFVIPAAKPLLQFPLGTEAAKK